MAILVGDEFRPKLKTTKLIANVRGRVTKAHEILVWRSHDWTQSPEWSYPQPWWLRVSHSKTGQTMSGKLIEDDNCEPASNNEGERTSQSPFQSAARL